MQVTHPTLDGLLHCLFHLRKNRVYYLFLGRYSYRHEL
uniref:Uncharacterized protein n=1 Tax=Arundo donax TaxID=35708 RepID=A0A0A9F981_ARUDO